jgi:hypothetical protein
MADVRVAVVLSIHTPLTKPAGDRRTVVESPREQSVCSQRVGHGHRPLHAGHPSRSQEPRPLLEQERCLRRQEMVGRRAQGCRRRTSSLSNTVANARVLNHLVTGSR